MTSSISSVYPPRLTPAPTAETTAYPPDLSPGARERLVARSALLSLKASTVTLADLPPVADRKRKRSEEELAAHTPQQFLTLQQVQYTELNDLLIEAEELLDLPSSATDTPLLLDSLSKLMHRSWSIVNERHLLVLSRKGLLGSYSYPLSPESSKKTTLKVELFVLIAIFSNEKKHPHGLIPSERTWHYANYRTIPAHIEELAGASSKFIYILLRKIQHNKTDPTEIHKLIADSLSERSHSTTATGPALAESSRRIQEFAKKINKISPEEERSGGAATAPASGAGS